ncbi:lytic transglycosylase domain-containing protein [Kineosporia mesophila]|nr:lytic transglycosylase domain-containing protein [Kineosporia mesophila]
MVETLAKLTGATRASALGSTPYADVFTAAGKRYGLDPALLSAVAKTESNYNASAKSPAGAQGLMQLMPGTARELGVDPMVPAQAVDGAARYLSDQLRTFGRVDLALAAYNAGPGAVRKYDGVPPYTETENYVRRVQKAWGQLR